MVGGVPTPTSTVYVTAVFVASTETTSRLPEERAADDFAAVIAALNLVGSIGQVIRRQSVKAHVKKDAVLVNAVHELADVDPMGLTW